MYRPLETGFYGKLPSHGDFLRRRVSDAFIGVWDAWLQECIAASRASLGDRWLDVYLTSPVWRFACAPGTCGPAPIVGVMAPSVDRVGRYFPLTVVAELPDGTSPLVAATGATSFFDSAERLVIDTIEAEHVDFERFDEHVSTLSAELTAIAEPALVMLEPAAAAVLSDGAEGRWQIPIASPQHLATALEQVLSQRLSALYDPLVIWWTEGSSIVEPSCLIAKGLPHPDTFAALLDGSWARSRWRAVPARVEAAAVEQDTLIDAVPPPRFRSAAATDRGRLREINQDAFLERTDVGVWVVADGVGGHSNGEVASRMVCDALADLLPESGFEEMVNAARERIERVNAHLTRAAARNVSPDRCGSTVVTLLTRGTRCAVLWAGDSRAYRLRNGQLEQLTRDHSLAESSDLIGGEESHAITRAVGAESTLTLDLYRDRVQAGDRFLLCSDGLTRSVPEGRIQSWLQHDDIRTAVDGLVKATLDAGAPDNVTVLVVEGFA